MRELYQWERANERAVSVSESKWESCISEREQMRELYQWARANERAVSVYFSCMIQVPSFNQLFLNIDFSSTVRFHDLHYADNGNSLRKPILQSIRVNSIRLPYANQTSLDHMQIMGMLRSNGLEPLFCVRTQLILIIIILQIEKSLNYTAAMSKF